MSEELRRYWKVLSGDLFSKISSAVISILAIANFSPTLLGKYIILCSISITSYSLFNGYFNRVFIFDKESNELIIGYRFSAFVCATVSFIFVSYFYELKYYEYFAAYLVSVSAIDYDISRTSVQKYGMFDIYSKIEIARSSLYLLFCSIIFFYNPSIFLIIMFQAISYLISSALIYRISEYSRNGIYGQVVSVFYKIFESKSLSLFLYFVLVGLFGQAPILIYGYISAPLDFAQFGSAFRYYGLLVSLSAAVNVVTLPDIAASGDVSAFAVLRSLRRLVLVAVCLGAAAAMSGFLVIPIIDGGRYPAAPMQFAILSSGVLFGVLLGPVGALYLRNSKHGYLLATQVAALGICCAVAYFGGQQSGLIAAAAMPIGVIAQLIALLVGLNSLTDPKAAQAL